MPVGPGADRAAVVATAASAVLKDPDDQYMRFCADRAVGADLESQGWDFAALNNDSTGWKAREWDPAVKTLRTGTWSGPSRAGRRRTGRCLTCLELRFSPRVQILSP